MLKLFFYKSLEQSNAGARIAILVDPSLDNGEVFDEYYKKRPRDPFPRVMLSDILVIENEVTAKKILKQLIDKAFDSSSVSPSSEPIVNIISRLEEFELRDTSDPKFGAKLIKYLGQFGISSQELKIQTPRSSTIFLAIPTTRLKSGSNTIFTVSRELFDPIKWYNPQWLEKKSSIFRDYSYYLFPLRNSQVRTEQKEVVIEEKIFNRETIGGELLKFVLRINGFGEVSFATSFYTVNQNEDGQVFLLGAITHLFWSFLCLIREIQESIGYSGSNHICIAMINTEGSRLGHFAKGWPDWNNEICRSPNVLVCRNTDLSILEQKVEPEIIYDMAEEIARSYNQPEARCFDKQTRKLPDYLWIEK